MTMPNVRNMTEQMAKYYTIPLGNMKFTELEKEPLDHSIILSQEVTKMILSVFLSL